MKAKLNSAFRELRKRHYFARQSFKCRQTCGWDAVPPQHKQRAVFYHTQDAIDIRDRKETHLAWSGDGSEIVSVMQGAGLTVEWDGSAGKRILVIGRA